MVADTTAFASVEEDIKTHRYSGTTHDSRQTFQLTKHCSSNWTSSWDGVLRPLRGDRLELDLQYHGWLWNATMELLTARRHSVPLTDNITVHQVYVMNTFIRSRQKLIQKIQLIKKIKVKLYINGPADQARNDDANDISTKVQTTKVIFVFDPLL